MSYFQLGSLLLQMICKRGLGSTFELLFSNGSEIVTLFCLQGRNFSLQVYSFRELEL
jgi:hypothetical protein